MLDDNKKKLAILVGIALRSSELDECERSLNELERLLHTAGASVHSKIIQVKDSYDPRTLIGKGKVSEVAEIVASGEASLVVFDVELSPAQIRNLENDIGNDVTVIDRSMLILDIFALHATSAEGKLQVELAQLKYTAPRLIGKGAELSRQGGGIGSRGPGESKLETDRRHLHERVVSLESRLRELESNRAVMRAHRDRSGIPKVALVGYTNAGKSSLLNLLTDADVLSENKLFATLDPTTRKMKLPSGEDILLTDTVGFIRKLPHHLVKAFKSTLDEVRFSDILLVVSDISDPEMDEHIKVTESIIEELGGSGKPIIYVYNKCDLYENASQIKLYENSVMVSSLTSVGIDRLLELIENCIHEGHKECILHLPYTEQSCLNGLYKEYNVISVDYVEDCVIVKALLDSRGRGMYKKYITTE